MRKEADHYYGDEAARYNERRASKPGWVMEMAAVESFVTDAPVLDVPVGTGRFAPIYAKHGLEAVGVDVSEDMLAVARREHPGLKTELGRIERLRFANDSFATAVCMRLMAWFDAEQMRAAMLELARVARVVVVNVRHDAWARFATGPRGDGTFTHSIEVFIAAARPMTLEGACVTGETADGVFEVFKFRR